MRSIDRAIDGAGSAANAGPAAAAGPAAPADPTWGMDTDDAGLSDGGPQLASDPPWDPTPLVSDQPNRAGGADEPRAGVVSRSSDGRLEVDATIDARLARARLLLADVVVRILAGEEPAK